MTETDKSPAFSDQLLFDESNMAVYRPEYVHMRVHAYDEDNDTFKVEGCAAGDLAVGAQASADYDTVPAFWVPAFVLACMAGTYGEPAEFVGKVFRMLKP